MSLLKRLLQKVLFLSLATLFRCFPISPRKVLFASYDGMQYSDNPKAIAESLKRLFPTLDIVWILDKKTARKADVKKAQVVCTYGIRSAYAFATARVLVTNSRWFFGAHKRKGQYYIQTWHGTPLKPVEKDANNLREKFTPGRFYYVRMCKADSRGCDLFLSGNRYTTSIIRSAFWYGGRILECGTPRNDLLLHGSLTDALRIKRRLGLKADERMLLFAPTFRKNPAENGAAQLEMLQIPELYAFLNGHPPEKWVIVSRFHPVVAQTVDGKTLEQRFGVRDASGYDDMQELLLAADMLITDYSSSLFDYALTGKPCILFIDPETRRAMSGRFYLNTDELPFPVCDSAESLKRVLALQLGGAENPAYPQKLEAFLHTLGNAETGTASESVARIIAAECGYRSL